jgi:hypothetical protein
MRVLIDLFRAPDGRLEGVVHTPGAGVAAFAGVLDLLRVLEGIELCRPPAEGDQSSGSDATDREDGDV